MFRLLLGKKKLILWLADWVIRVREVLSLAGIALVSASFFFSGALGCRSGELGSLS